MPLTEFEGKRNSRKYMNDEDMMKPRKILSDQIQLPNVTDLPFRHVYDMINMINDIIINNKINII